jgi:DNA-binding MarR family transcriptional regulator
MTTIVAVVKPSKTARRHPASLEAKVFVNLLRAADRLGQDAERLMKPHGLTGTQYNVLRILRGAEPEGLPCKGIGDRMISHDPDMTRLLDRMEKRGLITRERQTLDRRVVRTRITSAGLDILKKLDVPVDETHKRQFRNIEPAKLKLLAEILEEAFPEAATR